MNAGYLGLIGCWFYTLGAAHLYFAFLPAGQPFSLLLFVLFAAVMIGYGAAHTAFFAIASGVKVSSQLNADIEEGGKLGESYFQRIVKIIYIPVVPSSLMMIYAVLTGQSLYPRWMVFFLPSMLYLLKTPVLRLLPGTLREIVHDSYDNVILLIFYLISTIVLWNG